MAGPARSPWQIFWREFRKSPTALIGASVLVLFYACALAADFLAPYSMIEQNRDLSYLPPQKVRFASAGPFVDGTTLVDPLRNRYQDDPKTRYPVRFFVAGRPYRLLGLVPANRHLFGVDAPGTIHLIGTDQFGRDVLSRLLYGSRISLSIGLVGIAISFSIGILVGGLSGYFGGWVDEGTMRVTEILLSIPVLYLIVALAAILPPEMPSDRKYLLIVIILAFIGWATLARIVRGLVLSLREFEYVTAAKALGAGTFRVLLRHIIPNTLSFLIVAATISVPGYILGEVFLSFLGVGIQEPTASWGNMLTAAQSVRVLLSFPWILAPGYLIFLTVLAFNFLGDGLSDALNPRKIQGGKGG
ncbi:MAG TPA: ABC transporter permease [Candidatus Eisenbacteria bacterium]|nr:ABC transporter permease [Candidatus Eisenbacteria bacterium]